MGILSKIENTYACNFSGLIQISARATIENFSDKLYDGFCDLYSSADYVANFEWILRHYHAAKKLVLAALFFTQTEYILNKKLKNISYYSMYYSLLNAYSSLVILLPYLPLEQIYHISHSKVFNVIHDHYVRYSVLNDGFMDLLNRLRLTREAYSYRLPIGSSFQKYDTNELDLDLMFSVLSDKLPIVLQLSELISYISFFAWNKKVVDLPNEYDAHQIKCDNMFYSFLEIHDHLGKYCLIDDDDCYRQGYVLRNFKTPFPLSWVTSDILCEDLECGWDRDEDEQQQASNYNINNVAAYIVSCLGTAT